MKYVYIMKNRILSEFTRRKQGCANLSHRDPIKTVPIQWVRCSIFLFDTYFVSGPVLTCSGPAWSSIYSVKNIGSYS